MEFVEQDGRDALQRGIVKDHPGEDALGHDLDAGFCGNARLQAHAQAHRLADALAQRLGHALRGGARRQPAWLEQDDLAALCERLAQQDERDTRRLARAGRCHHHEPCRVEKRGAQGVEHLVDGQGDGKDGAGPCRHGGRHGGMIGGGRARAQGPTRAGQTRVPDLNLRGDMARRRIVPLLRRTGTGYMPGPGRVCRVAAGDQPLKDE